MFRSIDKKKSRGCNKKKNDVIGAKLLYKKKKKKNSTGLLTDRQDSVLDSYLPNHILFVFVFFYFKYIEVEE